MPVALNCCELPRAIDGFAGVIAIDTSVAGWTVKPALPVTLPEPALICDVPCPAPLASPPEVIVATLVFADAQVAALVRSWVVPFE